MDYVKLGHTGLDVSRICLGCMSYGVSKRGAHVWTLPEEETRVHIRRAIEMGINFFDTANVYSDGTSEEFLGSALRDFAKREETVIATKVYARMRPGPNGTGLSRKEIFTEIDASLKRLETDYVDLYQIHRWDYTTPIEETLEALHDVVKSGRARYIGASSMFAWQFAKCLHLAARNGWTRFVTMQNHWNLIYREEEREMMPLCLDEKIGIIPWSPLARGRLTRDWDEVTKRLQTDEYGTTLYTQSEAADRAVSAEVAKLAAKRGVSRAQIALAWLLQKPGVTAPIIGATSPYHLEDAVAALSVKLTAEEVADLETGYIPHHLAGFQ